MVAKKKNAGRKNKYFTHVKPRLKDIEHWCRDGLTEEEICKRLGVSVSSFSEYKNKYPELLEVLKRGKEEADYAVEDALFKRAIGYQYEEVTYQLAERINPDTGEKETYMTEAKRVTKEVPPDVTAAIFWLKNRCPDKWRDKRDVEHSGAITNNHIDLSQLTTEELKKLAKLDSETT